MPCPLLNQTVPSPCATLPSSPSQCRHVAMQFLTSPRPRRSLQSFTLLLPCGSSPSRSGLYRHAAVMYGSEHPLNISYPRNQCRLTSNRFIALPLPCKSLRCFVFSMQNRSSRDRRRSQFRHTTLFRSNPHQCVRITAPRFASASRSTSGHNPGAAQPRPAVPCTALALLCPAAHSSGNAPYISATHCRPSLQSVPSVAPPALCFSAHLTCGAGPCYTVADQVKAVLCVALADLIQALLIYAAAGQSKSVLDCTPAIRIDAHRVVAPADLSRALLYFL